MNKKRGLSALTRDEKEKLLMALQEKKRREKLTSSKYLPNDMQTLVHLDANKFRERWVLSGNGAGKTTLLVQEAWWQAQGNNPITKQNTKVPAHIVFLLDSPSKIEAKILPEIKKWFHLEPNQLAKKGKPHISEISFKNGSQITFFFHQQDALIFEGLDNISMLIADEPPPRHAYVGLFRGLRDKSITPKVLVAGTPIGQSWIRQEVYEPWSKGDRPDTNCYRFHSEVNKQNLRDGYLEEFSARLSEKEREVRLGGAFYDLEGLALAGLWREQIHLIEPIEIKPDWCCVVALDPHPAKKNHACLIAADRDGGLYYVKEFASRSPADEFAEELKKFYQGYRVIDIVCDSLGASPGSGGRGNMSFIEVLKEHGVRARSTTYSDKSDEAFIEKIQQVLVIPTTKDNFGRSLPKLRVFKGNPGIVANITNVEWTKYRNLDEFRPSLNITNQDFLACLKYALQTSITFNPDKPKLIKPAKSSPWSGSGKSRLKNRVQLRGNQRSIWGTDDD